MPSQISDPIFMEAGIKSGLTIWRVENLKLNSAPPEVYKGVFYKGDSYVILKTEKSPRTKHDIHFWLGAQTSKDQEAVAERKAEELDEFLEGYPSRHRENQGNESARFIAYFKILRYKDGSAKSGFNAISDQVYKNRLYRVKGKRRIRVTEMPCNIESVNSGDVFALDTKQTVYVFYGSESNKVERIKGSQAAEHIKDVEHNGSSTVVDLYQDDKGKLRTEGRKFFTVLGANPEYINHIKSAEDGGSDTLVPQSSFMTLIKVSDCSGEMKMEEVASAPLHQDLLSEDDSYILDRGGDKLYVWHGKFSSRAERKSSMLYATEYINERGYKKSTQVTSCYQFSEPVEFRQCFASKWKDKSCVTSSNVAQNPRKQHGININTLHKKKERSEAKRMFDDGNGEKQIWRIEKMKPVAVQAAKFGEFYSGDCYVILYTYRENAGRGKEVQIIYFWIGAQSSVDERGAAAAFAVELDDRHGGKPVQMRIVQGKEPPHFMLIFKGTLIVRRGGVKSGFRQTKKENGNDENAENENGEGDVEPSDENDCQMFHVKGSTPECCKAVEVIPSASNLNSNDVFVVTYDITTYVWYGKGCSSLEMRTGDHLATTLVNKNYPMIGVHEGDEPAQFWSLVGGKQDYADSVVLATPDGDFAARMFHVSNAKGYIAIEEIFDFAQEDLIEDDVIVLDCFDEVYVWIGAKANEKERKGGLQIANEYVESDPSGRDPDTITMYQIRQGFEPPNFRAHFAGWDFRFKKVIEEGQKGVATVKEELEELQREFFPYTDLSGGKCPVGVDPCRKEEYLTDSDFEEVFGMSRERYNSLANWRKLNLKKEKKLF